METKSNKENKDTKNQQIVVKREHVVIKDKTNNTTKI